MTLDNPPGRKWPLILGAAGFAAGFFGPMIFVPDANQGPMVGIFLSGPGGLVMGLILWGTCSAIELSAPRQWRLLWTVAGLGVLLTLLCVQPEPALRGYVYDGEVESCRPASDPANEESVLRQWGERITRTTWATPRAGWQAQMSGLLRAAPGVLVTLADPRQNAVRENRKPWNHGSQFASGWAPRHDDLLLYDATGSCEHYAVGSQLRGFQPYDYDERIQGPNSWPPEGLIEVLGASPLLPVPEKWASL